MARIRHGRVSKQLTGAMQSVAPRLKSAVSSARQDYFASDRSWFAKSQFTSWLMKVSMYFGRAFWVSR